MNKHLFFLFLLGFALTSCVKESYESPYGSIEGRLSKRSVMWVEGFEEQRAAILEQQQMSPRNFIVWSTWRAWELSPEEQTALKKVRTAVPTPSNETMLQKVISLEALPDYLNNTYGGTVGGFVSVAADMKNISTMYDTYWGLRLDYAGSKFKADGAGYAVIRFYSPVASTLTIPFCPEMGGTQPHDWPNTGGGFTASELSFGGYPEYTFPTYSAPNEGAEIYEVSPMGRELLRAVYKKDKGWTTNEVGVPAPKAQPAAPQVRNGVYASSESKSGSVLVSTWATYQGRRYSVWGRVGDTYRLTTQTPYENVPLEVEEKGVWAISVPVDQVEALYEESRPL